MSLLAMALRKLGTWWHLKPDSPDLEEAERRQREITARLETLQRNRDVLARRNLGHGPGHGQERRSS